MNNVEKLPDCYAKGTASNNYKLLNLNEQAIADIKKDAIAILEMLDLQQATGYTLDLYGDLVGQKRGMLDDTQYRYEILSKMGINVGQGNYMSVINTLMQIFRCEANDIILEDDTEKAAMVKVVKFTMQLLVNASLTPSQAVEIIESLLPTGVGVISAKFEGTFEFADSATEYDETAGFGNLEQSIGGDLGFIYA